MPGGRPSLPDYNRLENLAIATAGIVAAAKPERDVRELDTVLKQGYAVALREAVEVHGPWPEGVRWAAKDEGKGGVWTEEDSVKERTRAGTTSLWARYQSVIRKAAQNEFTPALCKLYLESTGELPSGTTPEEAQ